jgi:hypothetical protein
MRKVLEGVARSVRQQSMELISAAVVVGIAEENAGQVLTDWDE